MKTILTSMAAASLLAMLAVAQPPRSAVDRARFFGEAEIQPAASKTAPTVPTPSYGPLAVPDSGAPRAGNIAAPSSHSRLVYVITGSPQFGVVDLHSGTFLPIGPALPPDVGGGLVQGPDKSLLTLAFSGLLVAIDPVTGKTSTVGSTGLGDCSTPSSPCGPNSANGIGRFDKDYYLTDFANNLYSVDPESGAAKLIGLTGIPALPFSPLSVNPDGSQNVFNETLFSARGKLYANFAAAVRPQGGPPVIVIPPAIWEINPKTGHAKWIAPTELGLTSIVNVNETIYAFSVRTGQVLILDVSTGQTSAVSELDPAAGLIGGATPAPTFTAIDYPGAASTQALGINNRGDMVGYYTLADKSTHGFLLASDGNFTSIDFPGAAYTSSNGIGPRGDIVGEYAMTVDGSGPHQGFLRTGDGNWTSFDYPSAVTSGGTGINSRGDIVGYYKLADNLNHGFLLSGGSFTSIAFPGALQGSLSGINPQGDITGTYRSADNVVHGFLLSDGDFTSIDFPNATYTNTTGIDARGDIVGRYLDAANVSHGYLLRDGQLTTIDFPGATFTGLTGMNKSGDIVGRYSSPDGVFHGFLLTGFQPPCSTLGAAH